MYSVIAITQESRCRRESETREVIACWQEEFGLLDWKVECHPISIFQVSDEYCRVGKNFVGISRDFDRKVGTIHHTRKLTEEDIVHELLHVRYPQWSEDQVNTETIHLLKEKQDEILRRERKKKYRGRR